MGITRTRLSIDEHFTSVPNEWARDVRLSRRARGLLVEVMSHRVGWHVTIRSLMGAGTEGRDAIRSAIGELLEFGYVKRSQGRGSAGKFGEIEYELCDPPAAVGFPDVGSAVVGSADVGESDTKKNIYSEDHLEENHHQEIVLIAAVSFDDFWAVWPRKVAKPDAQRAWAKALKAVPGERILSAAIAYRDNPSIPEKRFIPHPATWLNRAGWDDELPSGGGAPMQRARDVLDLGRQMASERAAS